MKHLMKRNKNLGAWLTVFVASFLYLYDFLIRVAPGVLANELLYHTQVNQSELILINSLFYYGYAVMQIPAGLIVDRFGPKKPMIFGTLLGALSIASFTFASTFWPLAILRFFSGAGVAFAYICPMVYAHYFLPKRYFAMIGGLIQCLGCFGAILGTAPVVYVDQMYDWQFTLWLISSLGLLIILAFTFIKPVTTSYQSKMGSEWRRLTTITRLAHTWLVGLIGLILWSPMLIIAENLGVQFLEATQIPTLKASLFILVIWLTVGISGPFHGYWSSGNLEQRQKIIYIGLISTFLGTIGFIYFPVFTPWLWCLFAVLIGFGCSSQCVAFGIIDDINQEENLATAIGVQNMFTVSSGITVLPFIGWLSNALPYMQPSTVPLATVLRQSLTVVPTILIIGIVLAYLLTKIKIKKQGLPRSRTDML